jgi:hypothetical protein
MRRVAARRRFCALSPCGRGRRGQLNRNEWVRGTLSARIPLTHQNTLRDKRSRLPQGKRAQSFRPARASMDHGNRQCIYIPVNPRDAFRPVCSNRAPSGGPTTPPAVSLRNSRSNRGLLLSDRGRRLHRLAQQLFPLPAQNRLHQKIRGQNDLSTHTANIDHRGL